MLFLSASAFILSREPVEIITYNKFASIAFKGFDNIDSAITDLNSGYKGKNSSIAILLCQAYCLS